jgi:hypothetical protein
LNAAAPFRPAAAAWPALQAIVADPAHGQAALSNGQLLGHLLSDYLPEAPREARILVAAADAGVPDRLREQAASGVDVGGAIRLAASSFAASSGYSAQACEWAAGEFAIALGLVVAGQGPAQGQPDPGGPGDQQTRTWTAQPVQVAQPTSPQAQAFPANQYQAPGGHGFAATQQPYPYGPPQPAPAVSGGRRPAVIIAVAAAVAALAIAGAALAVASSGNGGGGSSPPAKVVIGPFTGSRPATIIFSGDGSSIVNHIHWSSWSATRASGTGTWNEETCIPDCATGGVNHYPAALTFSSAGGGKFTELTTIWNGQTTTWSYPRDWPQDASG